MVKEKDDIEFDFFDIDINRLDKEWVNQPKIFFKYASELADARRRLEQAKAESDVVKASMDRTIRENPISFGLPEKVTETLISNTVIQQPEYQDELKTCRRRKHKLDILQAAVSALDHRKSALERLVSLHGQSYFAAPKPIDGNSKEVVGNIEKGAARLSGKKRKKRNKK